MHDIFLQLAQAETLQLWKVHAKCHDALLDDPESPEH